METCKDELKSLKQGRKFWMCKRIIEVSTACFIFVGLEIGIVDTGFYIKSVHEAGEVMAYFALLGSIVTAYTASNAYTKHKEV